MRKWSRDLKAFAVRCLVCLVILGLGYVLLFVALPSWLARPSVSQQIASLRVVLNQGYIYGNSITAFDDRSVVAYSSLNDLVAQFEHNTSKLDKIYADAKKHLSPSQQQQTKTIIQSQKQAAANLTEQYGIFANLLRYDPANDFGNLHAERSAEKIAKKAHKAEQGLSTLAQDGRLDSPQSSGVQAMADCLKRLSNAAADRNATVVKQTKEQCSRDYPALRAAAIRQIIAKSFSPSYQTYMKEHLPPLLKSLDDSN